MTAHQLDLNKLGNPVNDLVESEEEFSIPLDISDIIETCREYAKLGWQIQSQVENILENGVDESVKSGVVKRESLLLIKSFLKAISQNVYFGDASSQAEERINEINLYLERNFVSKFNLN